MQPKPIRVVYNTPMRRSLLLCSWLTNEFAKFTNRQNQSVRYAFYHVYVCPPSAHRGFRYRYRRYKGNTFTLKTTLFSLQNAFSSINLTLLNINMSKKSTFAWFFLAKRFVLSNDYSYFCTVSSHQASQRCSNAWGFFVYIRYSQTTLMERLPHFIKHYMTEANVGKSWGCHFRWSQSGTVFG